MKNSTLLSVSALMIFGAGCSDPLEMSRDTEPIDWKGNYLVEGTWDLSSPFSSERTFSDAFAEILSARIVSAAGVPSSAEEEANELVLEAISGKVGEEVDAVTPASLQPDSDLMQRLAEPLSSVRVVSEIELEEGSFLDDLAGTEEVMTLEFSHEGQTHVLAPAELAGGAPGVTLAADWTGGESENVLSIDSHDFELRYGQLVSWVLLNVLEEDGNDLASLASEAVDCTSVVSKLTNGRNGVFVEVAGDEYGVETAGLETACTAAIGDVTGRTLGLFAIDAKITLGGDILILDDDGDGRADRLESDQYAGHIGVAPEPVAPRLNVSFVANRIGE